MELIEAIYGRRAVRDYTPQEVSKATVAELVDAAIQAPTALDEQAWIFAVIQGGAILADYSDRAKAHFLATFNPGNDPHSMRRDLLMDPKFNLFYNAGTLLVVYARPNRRFALVDCCLAAENLMLAAYAKGLGTCPVGFAQSWFDLPEIKAEIKVSPDNTAVIPLIVGYPARTPRAVPRGKPEIVYSA
jgi:nitroreductase